MTFHNIIFFAIIALFLFCGNDVTAAASVDETTRRVNLHQAISEARHRSLAGKQKTGIRDLSLEQCVADTRQLFEDNPSLVVARDKVNEESNEEEDRLCDDNNSNNTCIVNENDMESSALFRQACWDAGGRIFEYDQQWECTVTSLSEIGASATSTASSTTRTTTTYEWLTLNIDYCAHPSCNRENVLARLEQHDDTILDNIATTLSSSTDQVKCDANLNLVSAAVSINSLSYLVQFFMTTGVVAVTLFV